MNDTTLDGLLEEEQAKTQHADASRQTQFSEQVEIVEHELILRCSSDEQDGEQSD